MKDQRIGFGPSGERFPVHAPANPLYGRGALLGLAIGDAVAGGSPDQLGTINDATAMACELVASLMAHGALDRADLAARYGRSVGFASQVSTHALARTAPIGLFFADRREALIDAALDDA